MPNSLFLYRLFFFAVFSLSIQSCTSSTQTLPSNTTWEGHLMGVRFIMKLNQDSASKETIATFDSPDHGAFSLPVSKLLITNDSLLAYSSTLKADFKGKFSDKKLQLAGKWNQMGKEYELNFKRVPNEKKPERPQNPKAPFPYSEEKIIYSNTDKSIQYGATLTIPSSVSNAPVVILITGSGQEDRDETVYGHKPFWVIADHLSRNGIAVLRVDDRGVGQSTGNVSMATSADFAKDVLVGVKYLKSRKDLHLGKIGLIGHSEGGIIAPIAANQSKDISFIISLAGIGIKGSDLTRRQLENVNNSRGFTTAEKVRADSFLDSLIQLAGSDMEEKELKIAFQNYISNWLKQQPDSLLEKMNFKGKLGDDNISGTIASFSYPWIRYILKYDPAHVLSTIQIPFLALNGGKDIQVIADENLKGFDTYLKKAGNKDYKTVLLPNLNHFFQNAKTGKFNEYPLIEETISPEVLDIITRWITDRQ